MDSGTLGGNFGCGDFGLYPHARHRQVQPGESVEGGIANALKTRDNQLGGLKQVGALQWAMSTSSNVRSLRVMAMFSFPSAEAMVES